MSDLENKTVFANNLKYYMKLNNKTRLDVCNDLGFSYTTFTSWCKGQFYPRIDKIEALANYFGIEKSDLIENKSDIKRLNIQDFAVNNSNYDNKYDISKLNVPTNSFGMMKFYESMKKIQEFQNADLSEKDATDIANLLDAIVPFIDKKTGKTDDK